MYNIITVCYPPKKKFAKHLTAIWLLLVILIEDEHTGSTSSNSASSYTPNHVSQFTLQPISSSDVANPLKTINPRKLTGADYLEPFFLKLSASYH